MAEEDGKPANLLSGLFASTPPTDSAIIHLLNINNHFAAIGKVAVKWTDFETSVDLRTIRLAELSYSTGFCLTFQIAGIGRKLDAYISLARLKKTPQALIVDLCKFSAKAQDLSERRNRTVHDIWFFDHPNTPERFATSARKALNLEFVKVPTEKLFKLADEIEEYTAKFAVLADQVVEHQRTESQEPPMENGE